MYNPMYSRAYSLPRPMFPSPNVHDRSLPDMNRERRRALAPINTANLDRRPVEFYTKPYNRYQGIGGGLGNFGQPMYLSYYDTHGKVHFVPNHLQYYPYSDRYLRGPLSSDNWYHARHYIVGTRSRTRAEKYKEKYLRDRDNKIRAANEQTEYRRKIRSMVAQSIIKEPYDAGFRMSLPELYPFEYTTTALGQGDGYTTPVLGPGEGYRHEYRQSACLLDAEFDNPGLYPSDEITYPYMRMSPEEVQATLEAYANPQPLTPYPTTAVVDETSEPKTPELSPSKISPSFASFKSLLSILTPKAIGGMRKNKNKSGTMELGPLKKSRSASGSGNGSGSG